MSATFDDTTLFANYFAEFSILNVELKHYYVNRNTSEINYILLGINNDWNWEDNSNEVPTHLIKNLDHYLQVIKWLQISIAVNIDFENYGILNSIKYYII